MVHHLNPHLFFSWIMVTRPTFESTLWTVDFCTCLLYFAGSQKSNTSAPELGKIQGNASITYNTAGCPYPQKAAGVLEEEMTMGGENKDGQAKGRSAIQQVKPVVPQAFIPHVVQVMIQ